MKWIEKHDLVLVPYQIEINDCRLPFPPSKWHSTIPICTVPEQNPALEQALMTRTVPSSCCWPCCISFVDFTLKFIVPFTPWSLTDSQVVVYIFETCISSFIVFPLVIPGVLGLSCPIFYCYTVTRGAFAIFAPRGGMTVPISSTVQLGTYKSYREDFSTLKQPSLLPSPRGQGVRKWAQALLLII